ncbi:hypothetical protein [Bradyrhizobium oligotrophicum]|nr:hypothetical protein [Bradyrhizobium oligotrophicum]
MKERSRVVTSPADSMVAAAPSWKIARGAAGRDDDLSPRRAATAASP